MFNIYEIDTFWNNFVRKELKTKNQVTVISLKYIMSSVFILSVLFLKICQVLKVSLGLTKEKENSNL